MTPHTMKNMICPWKHLVRLLVAVACLAVARAADTNVTRITHVNAEQAQKLVTARQVVVLDVRTPKEFAAGHIAGAKNLDFSAADFEQSLAALDKNQTYLVHCASGSRSTRSLPQFEQLKFKSIYHLAGGLRAWQKAKLPVE